MSLLAFTVLGAGTAARTHPVAAAGQSPVAGVTCKTVQVAMRDGTRLTTNVYLPQTTATARYPVILERSPYDGPYGGYCYSTGEEVAFASIARHGYAGVFQVVRGTAVSGGTFNPFSQEIDDAYDTTEWAAAQSWSTGRVGMTGVSYLGIDQWMAAIAAPPHLYAINPDLAGSDFHDSSVFENGALRWSDGLFYGPQFVPDAIDRAGRAGGLSASEIAAQIAAFNHALPAEIPVWTKTLPIGDVTVLTDYVETSFIPNWIAHPDYDKFWAVQNVEAHYGDITVPALIGGASMDLFNIGAIRNFQGMRSGAATAAARSGTKLYWRAYGHAGNSGKPTFGNDALRSPGLSAIQLAFFDHYLKGLDNEYAALPNAQIYVLVPPDAGEKGFGFWLAAADFPVPGTVDARLSLGSEGHANSRLGDGVLSVPGQAAKTSAASDSFTYDPLDPVPTVGGNLLGPDTLSGTVGFADQSKVELRNDVLVYTSTPLSENYAVIGTIAASFWAITSAADTDFTVKVVDVHPDGLTNNVVDRIVGARYRLGSTLPPSFITPGQPEHYAFDVGNTAMMFRKGHRIRVEISSSNFPKFARNLNTTLGERFQGTAVIAHQTLLHSAQYPSYVEVPIAPNVTIP